MGAPTKALPEKQDEQGLQLDTGRRRSMRVLLSVPIQVTGKTKDNQKFEEETRTPVVNAHGALISLAAKLVTGQQVSVNNRATQKSMNCRVVYVGNPAAGKMQMGVEFVEPCPSFWQIDFPPDDWVVPEN
jgi:c-di-GMP-binding flagellar brake protein YcgR